MGGKPEKVKRNALVVRLREAGVSERQVVAVAPVLWGESISRARVGQIVRETVARARREAERPERRGPGRPRVRPKRCPVCGGALRARTRTSGLRGDGEEG